MRELRGPIPGQSLTTPPKGFPWERPPEITDPEEAIQMHLARLSQPDMMDALAQAIELQDLDIKTVTNGILRGAVASGIHSVDVSLLVAPVIHEFIKQTTKALGIEADDGFVDKKAKAAQDQAVIAMRAKKQLKAMGVNPKEVAKSVEAAAVEPAVEAEPAPIPSKGLMSRGAM